MSNQHGRSDGNQKSLKRGHFVSKPRQFAGPGGTQQSSPINTKQR
jgi:hypothetical protein